MHVITTHTDILSLENPKLKSRFIFKTWDDIAELIDEVVFTPDITWEEEIMTEKGIKKRRYENIIFYIFINLE